MNARWVRGLIALGALLVFGAVNVAIVGKERIRRNGEVVYLPLASVDPRSLMQGDYMALRFAFLNQIDVAKIREGETGLLLFALDRQRVARLAQAADPAPMAVSFRMRGGQVWVGTNAFFFREGTGERFARARYGEFRVDRDSGEAVLVGLRDAALQAM